MEVSGCRLVASAASAPSEVSPSAYSPRKSSPTATPNSSSHKAVFSFIFVFQISLSSLSLPKARVTFGLLF